MKLIVNTFLIFGFILTLSGCGNTPQNIYHWDRAYMDSVYEFINEDGDINEQIGNLEKMIQDSDSNKKKVAPGLYAHLGLLYSKVGNTDKSMMYLDKEKELFPESAQYINFLKNKGAK